MKPCLKAAMFVLPLALMACGKPTPRSVGQQTAAPRMQVTYLQNATPHGLMVPEAAPCEADQNWQYADMNGQEILFIAPGATVCAAFPERQITANFVALKLEGRADDRPVAKAVRIDQGNVCGGRMDLRKITPQAPIEIAANCQEAKQ